MLEDVDVTTSSGEHGTPGEHATPGQRPVPGLALRFGLLGRSLVLLLGTVFSAGLLTLWIAAVSVVGVGAGVPLILLSTVAVRWLANAHRRRAADQLGMPIARPYLPKPAGGWLIRVWTILRDPASWRDCAWLVVNSVTGWFTYGLSVVLFLLGVFYVIYPLLFAVTPPTVFRSPLGFYQLDGVGESFTLVPLGLMFFVLWYVTAVPLATLNARLIRALLAPTERARLRARVRQLASSRAETIDTQASELRRIERDLHDGPQAWLVSLGMSLGLAERQLADDPAATLRLLVEARESTANALADLRELVRGIRPPVLADRGLEGAVQALAMVNPVPATVVFRVPGLAARARRVRRLLRDRRGTVQRDQACPGPAHPDHARVHARAGRRRRAAVDAGVGRREGRRHDGRRDRAAWHRAAPVGLRRHAGHRQPGRRAHRRENVAAVRIVIAEDLALLRVGLIRIFETYGFEVVEAVDNGPSLVRALTTLQPDIAVVDVRLPPKYTDEGLRAAIEAREKVPGLPVLVLSQYVEPLYARELLSDGAGAVGYLLKDRVMDVDRFIASIRQVAAGGTAMDPEVVATLLARRAADVPLQALTPREREVLSLMAEGRSNAAIASRMFITEKAVSKHSNNIFAKLGLEQSGEDNRRVLAVLAYLES